MYYFPYGWFLAILSENSVPTKGILFWEEEPPGKRLKRMCYLFMRYSCLTFSDTSVVPCNRVKRQRHAAAASNVRAFHFESSQHTINRDQMQRLWVRLQTTRSVIQASLVGLPLFNIQQFFCLGASSINLQYYLPVPSLYKVSLNSQILLYPLLFLFFFL